MKIEYYEKIVLILGTIVLLTGIGAIGASIFAAGIHLPPDSGKIDPRSVRETPPFDKPGVYEVAPGEYEAVIIAQTWVFAPGEIRVPVGSKVTFVVASPDVTHGFMIEKTKINAMVVPGQITRVDMEFDRRGEYLIICHEYCGIGHHGMYGRVVVE